MDPVFTPFAVGIASQLAADTIKRVGRLVATPGGGQVSEAASLLTEIVAPNGEVLAVLTSTQDDQLAKYLCAGQARALVEARALIDLAFDRDNAESIELKRVVRADFVRAAAAACEAIPDSGVFEIVWEALEAEVRQLYVSDESLDALDTGARAELARALGELRARDGRSYKAPAWLRELISLAGDVPRLERAAACATDLREAGRAEFRELRLEHALEDARRPLEKLYVQRTLESSNGAVVSTQEVLQSEGRVRIVITGAPGGGKSTLTQHLLHSLSLPDSSASTPIRVRVRDLDLNSDLLVDELAAAVRSDFQAKGISADSIGDLLTLGRALVVFDGLDEVLELPKRKSLVRKIEAFSRQHPLASVVVTSRDIGYEYAALDPRQFERFHLVPFASDEVTTYAHKWFGNGATEVELANAFIRDVEAVPDLRENPLILSLLCTLYKARGHIPRNRRLVYTQCADLLFHRWDSMRQIDQPTDHIDHGQDLMQEIALLFSRSTSAQRGIEERQLQKLIATYLQDSAGVLVAPATTRAREFLNFCAGRAWLLGNAGTSFSGERLFIFTHRTFMEFFAAEGLARSISDPEKLAVEVTESFERDASSVVPELIVLAAEASRRNAAREILKSIKDMEHLIAKRGTGRFLPLRLRIAAVLALQPRVLDGIIVDSLEYLARNSTSPDAHVVLEALLSLPRDARARAVAHLTSPDAVNSSISDREIGRYQEALLQAWVAREFLNRDVTSDEWMSALESIWGTIDFSRIESQLVRYYYAGCRRAPCEVSDHDLSWMVLVPGAPNMALPGLPCITLGRVLSGESVDSLDATILKESRRGLEDSTDGRSAITFARWLEDGFDQGRFFISPPRDSEHRSLLVRAAFTYWEALGEEGDLIDDLGRVCRIDLRVAGEIRERSGSRKRPPDGSADTLTEVSSIGDWAKKWVRGRLSFVSTLPGDDF